MDKATSTCSNNVSQNDIKEFVRTSASVRSTIADKMRMVIQLPKEMQLEEEEDARHFFHNINKLAKIPTAVQQADSNTTLPKPAILASNSDQQISQGPEAPSDLESISQTTSKSSDGESEKKVTHDDMSRTQAALETTATTTSNQEPPAVLSAPNDVVNFFFLFVNLVLIYFVIFLQKTLKKCVRNILVTDTEGDTDFFKFVKTSHTDSACILEQDHISLAPSTTNQIEPRPSVPKADDVIVVRRSSSSDSNKNNEIRTHDDESSLVPVPDLSKQLIAREKRMRLDFRAEKRERNHSSGKSLYS